jgi:Holliday junction resolvase
MAVQQHRASTCNVSLIPPKGIPEPMLKLAVVLLIAYLLYKEWKSKRHSARTLYGYEAEVSIALYLKSCGAEVQLTNGSRGPYDILAQWGKRKCWVIQVKASRDGSARMPGPGERERLIVASRKLRAWPVIALREYGRTTYLDAWTLQRVNPPRA